MVFTLKKRKGAFRQNSLDTKVRGKNFIFRFEVFLEKSTVSVKNQRYHFYAGQGGDEEEILRASVFLWL